MESVKTSLSGKLCKYITNALGCFVGLPKGVVWKKKTAKQLLFSSGKADCASAVALVSASLICSEDIPAESALGVAMGK